MIKNINPKIRYFVFFTLFSVVFFVPRYFVQIQYDALEDEILAIGNNIMYSTKALLSAPDTTHPPLWYLLMEYPTDILGFNHGVFYYRLIQVVMLFLIIVFTLLSFYKKLAYNFIIIFFVLFSSNVYLIHLTSQHRMYAMVIGLSILYSFYWCSILINKRSLYSYKDFGLLGLIASAGFFTNYSFIWIILIFPLSYLLYKKNLIAIKSIVFFLFTFLVTTSWFFPFFLKNITDSIVHNQWSGTLNFFNICQTFNNYFGFFPMQNQFSIVSYFIFMFFFIMFMAMVYYSVFIDKQKLYKIVVSSFIIFFVLFLLAAKLTDRSILYPRTSITFAIIFYILVAILFGKNRLFDLLIFILVALQISQFIPYFFRDNKVSQMYFFGDHKKNTMSYLNSYPFPEDSCLLVIPNWSANAANYFLGSKIYVIPINSLPNYEVAKKFNKCHHIYVLDQISVQKEIREKHKHDFFGIDKVNLSLILKVGNQNLYELDN